MTQYTAKPQTTPDRRAYRGRLRPHDPKTPAAPGSLVGSDATFAATPQLFEAAVVLRRAYDEFGVYDTNHMAESVIARVREILIR